MFTILLARWYQGLFHKRRNKEVDWIFEEEDEFSDSSKEDEVDPDIRSKFQSASSFLPAVINKLDSSQILHFYALYKQATFGPAERTDRPSFFDVKANAKFKAWAQLNGMPKSVAMKTYVEKMVALNLGWNPSARCLSHGFGMHLSRPVKSSESLSDCSTAVTDREALLWFTAAKSDDVVTIMDIFERRPELLNQADQLLGMTALHWAIDSGCENVVRYLISKNADVNAIDPEDNTPLHFAAYCGRREAAEILISKGANRLLRNCDGQIPFEVCDDPALQEILRPPSLL